MITLGLNSPLEFERRNRDMEQRYRNVFGSAEGRMVLGDILAFCHFGRLVANEEERIEYNVGVAIARMSGMMGEIDVLMKMGED
jgi:hypothetical protein